MSKDPIAMKHVLFLAGAATIALAPLSAQAATGAATAATATGAAAAATATGRTIDSALVHGRQGHDALRKKGTIGMHAVRMGDVVGEHTVYLATSGERIELRHVATNRDTFARGALRAAAFVARKTPGRYAMRDVLGL